MRRETAAGVRDLARDADDVRGRNATLFFCELWSKTSVVLPQRSDCRLETAVEAVEFELLPVDPVLYENCVEQVLVENDFGHGQQNSGFSSRVSRQPVIRHAGSVR